MLFLCKIIDIQVNSAVYISDTVNRYDGTCTSVVCARMLFFMLTRITLFIKLNMFIFSSIVNNDN